jgi:outer membrane protein assembly factor BamB
VLYAIDATTLQTLYRSGATDLDVGGKYVTPVVAHGTVFVGTDRIQAFSLQP